MPTKSKGTPRKPGSGKAKYSAARKRVAAKAKSEKEPKKIAATTTKKKKITAGKTKEKVPFGSAFKAARKAGKKTFMWKGKKYTTEVK